jgi:hypothetical protein
MISGSARVASRLGSFFLDLGAPPLESINGNARQIKG